MTPIILFSFVIGYFLLLLGVAWYTSRNADNESFFIGNRNSNWALVAFGMIGTSLSGVTFVSVPGDVGKGNFHYFQLVLGYLLGYIVVAFVLLPLYYRLNLTSIYTYLSKRFGSSAHRTGASYFLLSRTVGATARLYLVVNILQLFILDRLGIPFWLTALVILILIMLYTIEGGVKTIVFTDTLQTSGMLIGLVVCLIVLLQTMDLNLGTAWSQLSDKGYTKIFNWDIQHPGYFWKQFLGGMFITITMTGLDQEMMQKNISVRTLKDSQKNMIYFSIILVFVNLLFLLLGGLLYVYAYGHGAEFTNVQLDGNSVWGFFSGGIQLTGDQLFPSAALGLIHAVPAAISVIFIIALISALFPSADGALTALTSSFCIDIFGLNDRKDWSEDKKKKTRLLIHFSFTIVFFLCILMFKGIGSRSIIDKILDLAGYTYGPLLGLFSFGILTKRKLPDNFMLALIAILSPVICYILQTNAAAWLGGYVIGIEILLLNGLITFFGLFLLSKKS